MASHSEMGDAPDQNEIGDVDSLASTVESDPEAEYLVNDIHAERRFYVEPDSEDDEGVFITQYLVEWTGYSMDRCSWEPREMFTSEETLDAWEKKKKQIVEGKLKPSFNLKSWEKKMAQLEKTTKKRKEARRRKREQRARQKSLPQAESSRLANSDTIDAHEPEAGVASDRAPSPPSVDSTIQALFVPAETPPPSKAVARQWLQQIAPPTSDTSSAQTPGNEPPGSTTMVPQAETTLDKPNSRLAKRLNTKHKPPARPKSPPQAAKPALSSFGTGPGTKRAYRENKWSERAPDLSQMELMKPSEFPPRTNIGATTSVVGPSVTSPKSPKAANQPASENSVSLTCPLKAGQTNGKATTQPQKPAVLAPSSVMAPPESRSSKLSPTVSISSSATQPKPLPQTNLTQPVDSVDPTVSTFSPRGEALLTNPGRSTSAFTAPSSAPRAPLQDNIDSPTGPSASPRTVSPPAVLSGARAKATSKKPAGLSDSPTVLSPAIPTRARAIPNLERPTENRGSRDSRETVRGHDTYRLESAYSTVRADTYRPSDLSRQPSPSRWSPPPRRSSPLRRSPPPRRSRSPPSRRPSPSRWSPPPRRLSPPRRSPPPRRPSPSRWSPPPRRSSPLRRSPPSRKSRSPSPSRPSRSSRRDMGSSYMAAQIARMPVRSCRARGCINIGDYWCNKALGEVLVHMFIGPDKRPLGAFRLCDIRQDVRKSLISTKNLKTNQIELWFKHLCTVREYERLCESSVSIRSVDLSPIMLKLAIGDKFCTEYRLGRGLQRHQRKSLSSSRGSAKGRPHRHSLSYGAKKGTSSCLACLVTWITGIQVSTS
jgi:hypothetical protein